jgi:hypothetical protein
MSIWTCQRCPFSSFACLTFVFCVALSELEAGGRANGILISACSQTDAFTHTNTHIQQLLIQVKQSHYRPGQALRVPGGRGSQMSRQSAHEGGKVVSPTRRPPSPQETFLVLNFVRGWVNPRAIVRPEELCQLKIPTTPSEIESETFRLVAQCLNQLRHQQRVQPVWNKPCCPWVQTATASLE